MHTSSGLGHFTPQSKNDEQTTRYVLTPPPKHGGKKGADDITTNEPYYWTSVDIGTPDLQCPKAFDEALKKQSVRINDWTRANGLLLPKAFPIAKEQGRIGLVIVPVVLVGAESKIPLKRICAYAHTFELMRCPQETALQACLQRPESMCGEQSDVIFAMKGITSNLKYPLDPSYLFQIKKKGDMLEICAVSADPDKKWERTCQFAFCLPEELS